MYELRRSDLPRHLRPPQERTRGARRHAALQAEETSYWKDPSEPGAPVVGSVSIDDRPHNFEDRRVLENWEGDLIIGARGASAAAILPPRTTLFTVILRCPDGKHAECFAGSLIEYEHALPDMMRKSLTRDQGSEMSQHAALTLATNMPVYFAHPRSPWERCLNENTNGHPRILSNPDP